MGEHGSSGIQKKNLSEQVADTIKSRILSLHYKPGTRFVIESLSAELGISVTPVRDGIRELVTQGFIGYDGNSYKVRTYTRAEIDDLFVIRTALEVLATQLAAKRASDEEISALRAVCARSEAAIQQGRFEALTNLDIELHEFIARCAGNEQLGRILHNIRERSWHIRRWVFGLSRHERDENSALAEHRAIIDRLAACEADAAARCMREHMENAERRTLDMLPVAEQ